MRQARSGAGPVAPKRSVTTGLRRQVRPRLVDGAFAAGWRILPHVPPSVAAHAFNAAGTASALRPGSYEQLRANLRQVVGPQCSERRLDALARRAVRSYARYWREVFQLPSMAPGYIERHTEFLGIDHVDRAMCEGRGVVVALTHSGNWDAAAAALCKVRGYAMTTVAERLEPASLYERFVRFRESLGMSVVPLTGGPQPSPLVLRRALKEGQMVTLLADRDLQGNGIDVTLLGRRTTMPPGPALMAVQSGAALVPLELGFTGDGWRVAFHREVQIPADGRLRERVTHGIHELAEVFTGIIGRNPQDWHMLQKFWPDV